MVTKKQKGQAITEAILMMVVFFGATLLISNFFNGQEVVASLVKKPWQNLSGMIQNGVWDTREAGAPHHPNTTYLRHISIEGERVQ